MIDITLAQQPVDLDGFETTNNIKPCLFLGFVIKNEYDNRRFKIHSKYKPRKFLHIINEQDFIPLYGIILTPSCIIKKILDIMINQEKLYNISLPVYENVLSQFSLTCVDCYSYFTTHLYPVNIDLLKNVTTDDLREDSKIFQHILSLDDNSFDFQQFGDLKIFLLT